MKRIFLQTVLGIILAAVGIYITYLYLQGLNNGSNFLLLVIAVVCIASSIFFFFKAGKSDDTVIKKVDPNVPTQNESQLENVLERNNQLSADWEATNDHRDRLRMLEIANTPVKP